MSRKTEQRAAIRRVFEETPRPLNAQEVQELAACYSENLGIATVYRNLKGLVDDGWLATVDLPNEPSRYELASLEHHHHFQCSTCSRVFDIPGCAHAVRTLAPDGFEVTHHEILLYGVCPDCT